MHHPEPAPATPAPRWLIRSIYGLAAMLGLLAGYDFGQVIGGPLMGAVVALNGALFCSIVAGALAERLCQWWTPSHRPRRPSTS